MLAFLERHGRADLFAQRLVRDAEHRRLADGRVLVEHLLELARIDVVATADDQVLLAIDDEVIAVLVDRRDVPGVKPARAHHLARGVVPIPIALHHEWSAHHELAWLAGRHVVVM